MRHTKNLSERNVELCNTDTSNSTRIQRWVVYKYNQVTSLSNFSPKLPQLLPVMRAQTEKKKKQQQRGRAALNTPVLALLISRENAHKNQLFSNKRRYRSEIACGSSRSQPISSFISLFSIPASHGAPIDQDKRCTFFSSPLSLPLSH